jgi:hypothetical protein
VGTTPAPALAGRLFDASVSLPTPVGMEEEESVSEWAAVCGVSVPASVAVAGTVKQTGADTDTGTAAVSSLTPREKEGMVADGPHTAAVGTAPQTGADTDTGTDTDTETPAEADEGGTGLLDVDADVPFFSLSDLGEVP